MVLDASALIAFLDPSDALHDDAVSCLLALGSRRLFVSPITHAEILVGPARSGTMAVTQAALRVLGISEVGLPADAAARLAVLRVTTGLKLPDCCVILAAQQSKCDVLTFDDRLSAAARDLGLVPR
jgi:predicted nucleic acid-binding protein